MAEAKTQTQTNENQRSEGRSITRRGEYYPSADLSVTNPFSIFRRLSDEMDRAFASTFGISREFGERGMWAPPIEVHERGNNIEISAELPGMTKDDVKVEMTDEGIVLEGEKRRERETDQGGGHRSERSYGHFYRLIPLPDGVEADKVKAEFKNGVLNVQLPISEQKRKSRQIPISG